MPVATDDGSAEIADVMTELSSAATYEGQEIRCRENIIETAHRTIPSMP